VPRARLDAAADSSSSSSSASMKPRIVPRTPASSGVDHPSSSRCSEIRSRDICRHGVVSVGGCQPPCWLSVQAGDNATSDSHQSWDGT
jgi:hypothetical protein